MSEDPDGYMHNESPKPKPEPVPLCTVPWHKHELFLTFLDGHGMGTLSAWMAAPESVHAIFHHLLVHGCDPYAAASLFMESYCAPAGTYRVDTEPDDDCDEKTGICFCKDDPPTAHACRRCNTLEVCPTGRVLVAHDADQTEKKEEVQSC